jgi:hypothetical protein
MNRQLESLNALNKTDKGKWIIEELSISETKEFVFKYSEGPVEFINSTISCRSSGFIISYKWLLYIEVSGEG